jgi:hypothetical protein
MGFLHHSHRAKTNQYEKLRLVTDFMRRFPNHSAVQHMKQSTSQDDIFDIYDREVVQTGFLATHGAFVAQA